MTQPSGLMNLVRAAAGALAFVPRGDTLPDRTLTVEEATVTGGLGAEIAARITEHCFYQLESPVLRVGGFSAPYPPSRLEEHYLPDLDRVLDAVDRTFAV